MSEFDDYIREVLPVTSIFRSLKKYVKELAKELLLEDVYIDKVEIAVTCKEYVYLTLAGYDGDLDLEIVAKWERLYDNVSNPYERQYELVDIEVEEIEYI